MLTDNKANMILQLRGSTHFSIDFIKSFDREWDIAVDRLKRSGANLKRIKIGKVKN